MKKTFIACAASLLFVAGSASAISITGEAGRHYTNLGFGMGTNTGGLTMSGNWARSDHDGEMAGFGLGFNLPIGSLMATIGGKGIYMAPEDGKNGGAIAVGGGLSYPITKSFALYGEGYVAPESMTSGMKSYTEANAGVRWNVLRPLTIDAGYRYINMEGKDGHRDNRLADGIYLGAGLNF
ncbi:yfaZ family protein [Yersinia ruckeri]|uniref:YfaZ family outer membrane protein n=1 Tax=Yersinia ruckeri TaxID=29486 RepID=UPI0005AC1AF7|nr:YfaZ family outer membrane protein [Yersinia ruckeri]AJI93691.1 yfaZ family protein [Yersinia ruckeri]MCW6568673.1 YfaZ family protein [Yersinia ruckeri]